ncbi:MAG TPA: polysaccharide biosynthesis tyrosine autokinase, partial [Balneolaceae bacterium]|nr:polysaccharide biosynthesis tyrosine autokinase [Balneolaceae bacterium]
LTSRDEVASRLRGRLTFEKAGAKNDVIKIYYESPSAVAAGQVVDITLHVFNRLSNRRNQASANTAAFFLSKEIRRIKDSLQTAENRLEKFRDNHKSNIKLANLKRNVKINEELYETITKQYVETTIWERSQFGLGRIIDKGYTPNGPSKPNRSLYILFGLIFGGVLGVGYVFLGFVFLDTINGKEKMANVDAPLLAVIPDMDAYIKENYERKETVKIKEKPISTRLITLLDPDSAISESFRQLEDNLIYARDGSRLKSIVITSSVQGEGKTATAANLGIVLAEAGHEVLVVDANFRRPHLHNIFGASETGGITKVLSVDLKLHDAIKSTPAPNLSLLPAGQPPGNVAATARSQSFLDLLRELEDHFDFVLIDTAPYGDVTDAAPVLKQADGAVVIAKFGQTKEKEVSEIVDEIHQLNATVLGTVLNAYNYTKSNDLSPASRYYK